MPDSAHNGHVSGLLFLHAQTALHPGSGTALGVVDLPVQRERHTQWPVIPGSSLKGVLRDCCRRQVPGKRAKEADADADLAAAFGPPTDEADKHAGALSLTDARILAFPVRSLRGVFAWATCPAVLERLGRDLMLAGLPPLPSVPSLKSEQMACSAGSPLLVDSNKVVLEEFEFTRVGDARQIAEWVAGHAVTDAATQERVKTSLAVLADDDFTHFVKHATEVVARVGLDYERKTVKRGALFYQEFLPAETLFYSVVFANASRRKGDSKTAAEVLAYLQQGLAHVPVLQIGGDETTGKGLCLVRLCHGKEELIMSETTATAGPTLDQRRARHAWEAVLSFAKPSQGGTRKYGDEAKEYAREAKKLPMRVMAAGLGQALSFLTSKAKEKKPNLRRLHEHLTDWVIKERPIRASRPDSLLESIIHGDSNFLRRATDETLAYLQWLNRFAEAEGLTEDQTGD